jgi:hypothetical protein
MYEELQVVKATKNLSDKVKMGCIGTILYVYFEEKRGYEVSAFLSNYTPHHSKENILPAVFYFKVSFFAHIF